MAHSRCTNLICKNPHLQIFGYEYCHHCNEDTCKIATKSLKPCPFCGSKVRMLYNRGISPSGEGSGYKVTCPTLGCIVSYSLRCYGTPEELIKAWNKRAELTKDI